MMGRREDNEAWWRSYDRVADDPKKFREARPFLTRWARLSLLRQLWLPAVILVIAVIVLVIAKAA